MKTPTDANDAKGIAVLTEAISNGIVALESEGLFAADAAELVGVTHCKWLEMHEAGAVPQAANQDGNNRYGRAPRWSRTELSLWRRAGAPSRATWESMKAEAARRAS
jgi:hypothetical protein